MPVTSPVKVADDVDESNIEQVLRVVISFSYYYIFCEMYQYLYSKRISETGTVAKIVQYFLTFFRHQQRGSSLVRNLITKRYVCQTSFMDIYPPINVLSMLFTVSLCTGV